MPYLLHLAIMLSVLSLLMPVDARILLIATVTSAIAIAAEGLKTSYVDDDFLMIVVPLIGLSIMMGI